MKYLDCSCFIGGWPFHKVRHPDFDDLRALHARNGIGGGFVSSTNAIFWNDPYEAERELAGVLAGQTDYRHVMTVNPLLPGTMDDLARAEREFPVAGIRILPGFHGCSLADARLTPLWDWLRSRKLPLFLTLRMEDERVTYLFHPSTVGLPEIRSFLETVTGFPVLLSNIRDTELPALKDTVLARPDVFADACGFKGNLFPLDMLYEAGLTSRIVYGSLAPVFCLRSTLLAFEMAAVPKNEIERMLTARDFLAML